LGERKDIMGTQATSKFKIEGWDEKSYVETEEGGKLTRASVKQTFEGDIHGEGQVEWLMCYRPDQTADFVGLQRVVGRIGDLSGSMVLESTGTFDGTEAKGPLTIVAGSGTGELKGIEGDGELRAPLGGEPSVSLNYRFN
jgi:Protein of unknown function (DUF3224)